MSITQKLEQELGDHGPKTEPRKSAAKNGFNGFDVFTAANSISTVDVLSWLGISVEQRGDKTFATCPGCQEDGAFVCKNGGLKCQHARCSRAGPPSNSGFRTNVDLVAYKEQCSAVDAARKLCERFGIHVMSGNGSASRARSNGHATEEPPEPAPAAQDAFGDAWVQLDRCPESLIDEPPRQDWLLTRWHQLRDVGVFPRGKTGLITGTGGTGKTYLLIELALAVALGGFWLGTFRVPKPGHVLLALGEEELEEAKRRLWRTANALGLSSEQRNTVASRLDLLPLLGKPVALTSSPAPGTVVETAIAGALRQRLEQRGVDWAAIILDPLSRWAGGGVEGDNEAATRFVQVIESLTRVRGNPAVFVAHHSSKVSAKDGSSDARGVTGIRDGFRWMATLDVVEDGETGARGVRFRNRKSNYSLEFEDLTLARNADPGIEGTLRVATDEETQKLRPKGSTSDVTDSELEDRVLATVRRHPGLKSPSAIQELTKGNRQKVFDAIKALRLDGRLTRVNGSFVAQEPTKEPS